MIRASWLKRMMARRSKGISTVIATIFLVLVAFLITTQTFLWTMTQNTLYNQAVKENSQIDADRFSERIATSRAEYTVPQPGTIQVNMTVSNEGPVSAQIITAWVVWVVEGKTKYAFNDTLNINLNPGEALPLTITVAIPYASSTGAFSGWLVTARGNLVSLEKEKIVVHAQVAEGIGSVMMDFETFKYYEVEDNVLNYSEGKAAFTIPSGENIILAAFLSNYDLKRRTITLDSPSLLWVYFPHAPGNPGIWNIVNVASNGTIIKDTYTPISLAYGESKWIFFGPGTTQVKGKSGAANLILLGKIDGQDYGQNLPFVSIYVS